MLGWGLLTSYRFVLLVKSRVHFRGNLSNEGLRWGNVNENFIVGPSQDLLHGIVGYESLASTSWS